MLPRSRHLSIVCMCRCASPANTCTCDIWFTGPNCDLLNLQPAENEHDGLQVPNYYSWGGHAEPDASGMWHGFFSCELPGSRQVVPFLQCPLFSSHLQRVDVECVDDPLFDLARDRERRHWAVHAL